MYQSCNALRMDDSIFADPIVNCHETFMLVKETFKKTGVLLKATLNESIADNVLQLSAALSYYTIFSLPPLLIIIISITGFFFGSDAVRGELFWQINGLEGNAAALQIQDAIKKVTLSSSNTFVTIFSFTILLIGASGRSEERRVGKE